jgi:hypothetical protein
MKTRILLIGSALILAAALLQPLSSAADGAKTSSLVSLNSLKTGLTSLQNSIGATLESLDGVKASANNGSALSKAGAEFQSRFKELELQVNTVQTQAVLVKARAAEHYESWQKDLSAVQNANIREKAQQRFTESKKDFDKIVEKATRAKQESLPFVSDLKDIAIYLDADLSADAVKSLSNNIWKIGNRSKVVIGKIGDVTEQIERTIKNLPKS